MESALSEASQHQLNTLMKDILAQDTRHHESQAQVCYVDESYELQLRLFSTSVLMIKINLEGALALSTNSKATRWGKFSS